MKTSNKEEEEPHFVKRDKFAITAEYKQWFADIKSRLRNSQIKAAIKVNSTLLEFYWSLGRDIVKMKAEQAWGSGVLQQLSFDLRDEFPGSETVWRRFICRTHELRGTWRFGHYVLYPCGIFRQRRHHQNKECRDVRTDCRFLRHHRRHHHQLPVLLLKEPP